MTRRLAVLAAAVVALVGCATWPDWSATPPGTVVDRGKRWVTVRQDDGRTVTHETSKETSRGCRAGERWPACTS